MCERGMTLTMRMYNIVNECMSLVYFMHVQCCAVRDWNVHFFSLL